VDNIVDEVPDAAPEIDVEVASADDVAAALHNTAGVPSGAEIYLQVGLNLFFLYFSFYLIIEDFGFTRGSIVQCSSASGSTAAC
jgi:hypothetical protein